MFDKIFGARAAKEFGTEMAMLLVKRAESETKKRDHLKASKKSDKRYDATLFSIEKQLEKFKTTHRLNIYSKAQLGSAFKYALLENDFDEEVAKAMTTWLLLRCN